MDVATAAPVNACRHSADTLVFSKEKVSEAAEALVGRSILFNWPVIGWHAGVLQRRVTDSHIKRNGEACNFYVFYEVDDDEMPTALRLEDYGSEDDDEYGSWVLLESTARARPRATPWPRRRRRPDPCVGSSGGWWRYQAVSPFLSALKIEGSFLNF